MTKVKNPSILYVSSFPPRECGIATFTQDLTNAMDKEFSPEIKSKILAINDNGTSIYNYPRKVTKQINETEMEDYINRANEINKSPDIKLVNIQHEYGLFGGEQGEYLLPFLELLKKPVIITMHTVLPRPGDKMKKIGKLISEKSFGTIVMNHAAKNILIEKYGIKKNKIHVIPHGVHHIAFPSGKRSKKKMNLQNKTILLTFGMISRDKGIEYAIEALPKIVKKYPNILYLIIGATHPVVRRQEGEKYRNKLKKLIVKHKLTKHVKFYNKYLELSELIDYLKATDIYVYPMLSRDQASSGSLSYAMSCGCPCVVTPSQYAKSVINNERGRFTRFKNSKDIEKALDEIISDAKLRKEMKKNNYFYTRHMTWQNVALSYFKIFNEYAKIIPKEKGKLPPINLDYIKNLTDDFGMIQFANHTKPDIHSGYCMDDNARALLGCAEAYEHKKLKSTLNLINIDLKFIKYALKSNGRFHNFVSYNGNFIDRTESDDSFGRAIWTLGYVINAEHLPEDTRKNAAEIFKKSIKRTNELQSLRAMAFTITGISHLNKKDFVKFKINSEKIDNRIKLLSDRLVEHFDNTVNRQSNSWYWFEDCLTYSNYKLPEALFRAYEKTKDKKYLKVAEKSLNFLNNITFEKKDIFSPIGQDGWYFRNGKRSYFDQQPEDAATAVEALTVANLITKKKKYLNLAEIAFQWFLGKNHLNQMVYDEATGGCYDGLGKYSLNFNQGAESTISYFLARLAIERIYE